MVRDPRRLCRLALVVSALAPCGLATGQPPPAAKAEPAAKDEKNPDIEKAGEALLKGKLDDALKHLEDAVKKKPDLPPARLMLARLLLTVKQPQVQQAGRVVFEQAAKENPGHPEVFLTGAALALADGRVNEAILNANRALGRAGDPDAKLTEEQKKAVARDARASLTMSYEAREDWGNVRTNAEAWLAGTDGKNGQARVRLARALFFLNSPAAEVESELKKAKADDPNLELPAVTLSRLFTAKKDYAKAREYLDKATQEAPKDARVNVAFADWLIQQNQLKEAAAQVTAALAARPDDPEALRLRGLVDRALNNFAAAEQALLKLANENPSEFFPTNQLALLYADQKDPALRKRAVGYAEANAQRFQRSPEALSTLGYVAYQNELYDQALQFLTAATAGGQASPDTAYFLALALAKKEKFAEAKKLLDDALAATGLFVHKDKAKELLDKEVGPKAAAPKKP